MNNERYNQIIDDAYKNYLDNFVPPVCPPNLDVQHSFYEPMSKEMFIKSIQEKNSRGDEFAKKWGLKIEWIELSLEERALWLQNNKGYDLLVGNLDHDHIKEVVETESPSKLLTITYNNETIEVYA